jgi:hypothetical protein
MSKFPTHKAYTVSEKKFKSKDGKEHSRWTEIGTVWAHEKGGGFDVVFVENVAVHGRIVLSVYEPRENPEQAPDLA